ncbi:glycosyltransferase family 39 protein [Streptomyces sp. TLI_105]|uniref:glycosyltransferase family 39 protein n=1 Tax=Streptomyces sp. TLI_105 TaxID=1881019 RepID=UPI00089D4802|nr:glycosyltransferase family 39 protein [Streptomyces sp. TLI_105]SEC27993.1 Dolichyl-phosphate-mannose-protein mannosyltransferase [Streptomyces sp. TLI_105]
MTFVKATAPSDQEAATPPPEGPGLAPVPWRPVSLTAAAMTVCLLVLATRHGYHVDELYTRAASRHLAWGYVDQPPLVALVAKAEMAVFGDNLFGFRVVPALLASLAVLLAPLIARELGGGSRAQTLAGFMAFASGLVMYTGHIMGTNNWDELSWITVTWLLIRMVRTRDTRLWWAIGVVVGVGLTAKYLLVLLLLCLGAGLLVFGPRRVFRTWRFPASVGVAVVIASPVLIWQITHGMPQLEMSAALSKALDSLSRSTFVPMQLLLIGFFLNPVWIAGLVALLRRPEWRAYRFVGWSYPLMVVVLLIVGGQGAYTTALQYVLLAAGAVVVDRWARSAKRLGVIGGLTALNAVSSAILLLPTLPINVYAGNPVLSGMAIVQFDQVGWPEMTRQVGAVYRSLPTDEQAHTVIYGNHYGQAGAIDRWGPEYGLPKAYSGHNSYADFGVPGEDKTTVIAIGVDPKRFGALFASCEPRGAYENDLPVSDDGQKFLVCRGPLKPWPHLWEQLRWIGFQCPYTAEAITAESAKGCD